MEAMSGSRAAELAGAACGMGTAVGANAVVAGKLRWLGTPTGSARNAKGMASPAKGHGKLAQFPSRVHGTEDAGEMRQDQRAILTVLLAVCLALDASDGLVANGEDSPGRGPVAPAQLRLAQPGALDLSLGIELPPLNPQQSAMTSAPRRPGPVRVGFHRQLTEYQGDWCRDFNGSMTRTTAALPPP